MPPVSGIEAEESDSEMLMLRYPFSERLKRKNSGIAAFALQCMTGMSCWKTSEGMEVT